ncbi:MAG: hypothetical protein ACYC0J_08640 [Gammaproteobacteria bacterium]
MSMLRNHLEPFYINDIAIPLAKTFHLLVASLHGHSFEEHAEPNNQTYLRDYYKTHNNDRFMKWLSLSKNTNIKRIIDDFNEGFILTFTGPAGIDVAAFLAFRAILIQYNPCEPLSSFATGELQNLYHFINNPDRNPHHGKMLSYINECANHLIWPALAWEKHAGTTRSKEKYTLFSRSIVMQTINNITADLPTLENLRDECSFFYKVPGAKQIKAVLKTIVPRQDQTLEDFFFTLQQTVEKQIEILDIPPPPEDLRAIVTLRQTFLHIKNIMAEAALRLEVIAFIYDPSKNCVDEKTFTINATP